MLQTCACIILLLMKVEHKSLSLSLFFFFFFFLSTNKPENSGQQQNDQLLPERNSASSQPLKTSHALQHMEDQDKDQDNGW